jgi:hypothetical protein
MLKVPGRRRKTHRCIFRAKKDKLGYHDSNFETSPDVTIVVPLSLAQLGQEVRIMGWVHKTRGLGRPDLY